MAAKPGHNHDKTFKMQKTQPDEVISDLDNGSSGLNSHKSANNACGSSVHLQ